MKLIFTILLFFIAISKSFSQVTYPEKYWIQELQRYTISIGNLQYDSSITDKTPKPYYNISGTGVVFYVKYQGKVIPVVVTAKHVLQNSDGDLLDSIRIRFSWHDNQSIYDYLGISIPLKVDKYNMVFIHPDSSIDLACFPLLTNSKILDSVSMIPYSYFPDDYQIFEGAEVYVLGYPGSVGRNYWTKALLRKAIIAWVPEQDDTKKFLIDCNVFPGNSGGPVFTKKPEMPILNDTSDYGKLFKFVGIVIERRFNYNKVQVNKNGKLLPIKDAEGFGIISAESIGVGVVEPAKNVYSLLTDFEKAINESK